MTTIDARSSAQILAHAVTGSIAYVSATATMENDAAILFRDEESGMTSVMRLRVQDDTLHSSVLRIPNHRASRTTLYFTEFDLRNSQGRSCFIGNDGSYLVIHDSMDDQDNLSIDLFSTDLVRLTISSTVACWSDWS